MRSAGAAFFPQDEALGVTRSAYSEALQREMVWLSAQVPYERAQAIAERIGGWQLAVGTIWQQTQVHGQRLLRAAEHTQQHVSLGTTQWNQQQYAPNTRQAVSMDGGMVQVRGEGWKELKVGLVADLPEGEHAQDEQVHLEQLRYAAVLGDVSAFEGVLWALAVEAGIPYAGQVVVTADGAAWIWRLVDNYFRCAIQVVDWYHACQHLAQAAQGRFPDDAAAAQGWTAELKAHLFKGEIHLIREQFNRYGLGHFADYFEEHVRRMQYVQFRAARPPHWFGRR